MAAPENRKRLLLSLIVIAGFLLLGFVLKRIYPDSETASRMVLATLAVYAVAGGQKGFLWGILAACFLFVHPAFALMAQPGGQEARNAAELLVFLAGTMLIASLTYSSIFIWQLWLLGALVLVALASSLWQSGTELALLAAVICLGNLLAGTMLALGLRQRRATPPPARANLLLGAVVAVVTPVLGTLLGELFLQGKAFSLPRVVQSLEALPGQIAYPNWTSAAAEFEAACWPTRWLVGPLVVWGFWRSLRRGWKDWRCRQPPKAWHLSLAVVLVAAWYCVFYHEAALANQLLVTAFVVLMSVYCVADLADGIMERLILKPPVERDELEVEGMKT